MTPRPTLVFSQPNPAAGLPTAEGLSCGDELRATLAAISNRVDAAACLQRQLGATPGDEAIDLGEYLRDISAAVVAALCSNRDIRLEFSCAPSCLLPAQRALAIGFIVLELVSNAVKYAHPTGVPGEISVACSQGMDGTVTVEVSDDGVGLPEGLDPMKADSLGLRLVRALAAQLNARVRFAHDALGLSCVLQIPGEQHV